MSDHIHHRPHPETPEPDYRASARRWRLATLGAFAAGAIAMAAVPATAEPRPEHSGASSYDTTTVSNCVETTDESDAPVLSNTGGTVPGYVYSGGSWGSVDGSVPDGAAD